MYVTLLLNYFNFILKYIKKIILKRSYADERI